jgi:hypothetical protein
MDTYPLPAVGPYDDISEYVPYLLTAIDGTLKDPDAWEDNDRAAAFGLMEDLKAWLIEFIPMADQFVKVTSTDAQPSYLADALTPGNNISLTVTTLPNGDERLRVDTQGLVHLTGVDLTPASGASVLLATIPAGGLLAAVEVVVSAPFDGAATVEIGTQAASNLFMEAGDNDLSFASPYSASPAYRAAAETAVYATFAGAATTGAARIVLTIQE